MPQRVTCLRDKVDVPSTLQKMVRLNFYLGWRVVIKYRCDRVRSNSHCGDARAVTAWSLPPVERHPAAAQRALTIL